FNAARLLGVSGSVGRLAPGCAGDVLLVDSDPLDDVATLSRPVSVVRAGTIC
ncbi:amidohydrolase family protein, partial [Streptomyces sp. SID5910]|uniref:amidohydrolase family protein n=1 Tax=Streptomyces sp. SID5910 TaxID=2690312 RepID=UPI00136A8FC0